MQYAIDKLKAKPAKNVMLKLQSICIHKKGKYPKMQSAIHHKSVELKSIQPENPHEICVTYKRLIQLLQRLVMCSVHLLAYTKDSNLFELCASISTVAINKQLHTQIHVYISLLPHHALMIRYVCYVLSVLCTVFLAYYVVYAHTESISSLKISSILKNEIGAADRIEN